MFKATLALSVCAVLISSAVAQAAGFGAGDVVVYRVGDGGAALTNAATAVFVDEYTPAGMLVQSIAVNASAAGNKLTASGTATSEGFLNLSADGKYLTLPGYNASTGTAGVASTVSSATNRVVGRIDGSGNVDLSTSFDGYTGNNIRSVASPDGSTFFTSGAAAPGPSFTSVGSVTSPTSLGVSGSLANTRVVEIYGGQLFFSDSSGSTFRLAMVGTGTSATANQTFTNLPGLSASTGSPYGFYMADTKPGIGYAGTGLDTLYIADDAAGLEKFIFDGTNWVAEGTIAVTGNALRGLTGTVTANGVVLYATTPTNLYSFTDTTPYTGTLSGSLNSIAAAPANTAFRGVDFAPTAAPEPASIGVLVVGGLALFARRRK